MSWRYRNIGFFHLFPLKYCGNWKIFWIFYRLSLKDTNLRTEPKHIVFLTQLLLLFKFCHICKADNPLVETREIGTEVVVKTTCINPKCKNEKTWYSQPLMPGTKIPAGNFLICMSILLAGALPTKVFQVFHHMALGCVSLNTFFKYQRVSCVSNIPLMKLLLLSFTRCFSILSFFSK